MIEGAVNPITSPITSPATVTVRVGYTSEYCCNSTTVPTLTSSPASTPTIDPRGFQRIRSSYTRPEGGGPDLAPTPPRAPPSATAPAAPGT